MKSTHDTIELRQILRFQNHTCVYVKKCKLEINGGSLDNKSQTSIQAIAVSYTEYSERER